MDKIKKAIIKQVNFFVYWLMHTRVWRWVTKFHFVRNPLDKSEFRNIKCICNSGLKTKRCCGFYPYVSNKWNNKFVELVRESMKEYEQEYGDFDG